MNGSDYDDHLVDFEGVVSGELEIVKLTLSSPFSVLLQVVLSLFDSGREDEINHHLPNSSLHMYTLLTNGLCSLLPNNGPCCFPYSWKLSLMMWLSWIDEEVLASIPKHTLSVGEQCVIPSDISTSFLLFIYRQNYIDYVNNPTIFFFPQFSIVRLRFITHCVFLYIFTHFIPCT